MTAILVRSLRVAVRRKDQIARQGDELALQEKAMNDHCMVDIADARARVSYVNDQFLRATGYRADELLGRSVDTIHLDSSEGHYDEVRAVLESGRSWSGETRLARKAGGSLLTQTTIVPLLDRQGQLIKTVALRTDITDWHRGELDRQSRLLLETLQDAVYVFAPDTLEVTYMNRAALDLHGWAECEVAGRSFAEIPDEYDAERFASKSALVLAGTEEVATCEVVIRGHPMELNLQLQDHGGARRFVVVARDISQRKRADAEKSAFVASVSHELRSPLTSINGALRLIASGAAGPVSDKSRTMIDVASRNVDRLIALINDLLDLEKLDADMVDFHMERVELGALIEEAAEANRMYAEELGVRLETELPDAPVHVTADRDRIMQVLTNLVSNAAKFSPPDAAVTLRLQCTEATARIEVIDRGKGIPPAMQARIFERFAQVDTDEVHRKRPGTGLGLSIVKSIVTRHAGRVRVESAENVGSTFFVELPQAAADDIAA